MTLVGGPAGTRPARGPPFPGEGLAHGPLVRRRPRVIGSTADRSRTDARRDAPGRVARDGRRRSRSPGRRRRRRASAAPSGRGSRRPSAGPDPCRPSPWPATAELDLVGGRLADRDAGLGGRQQDDAAGLADGEGRLDVAAEEEPLDPDHGRPVGLDQVGDGGVDRRAAGSPSGSAGIVATQPKSTERRRPAGFSTTP